MEEKLRYVYRVNEYIDSKQYTEDSSLGPAFLARDAGIAGRTEESYRRLMDALWMDLKVGEENKYKTFNGRHSANAGAGYMNIKGLAGERFSLGEYVMDQPILAEEVDGIDWSAMRNNRLFHIDIDKPTNTITYTLLDYQPNDAHVSIRIRDHSEELSNSHRTFFVPLDQEKWEREQREKRQIVLFDRSAIPSTQLPKAPE